jgi:uncharacterized membrane protein
MNAFHTFINWSASVNPLDWGGLAIFVIAVLGYRSFLALMLKNRPDKLYLGKLQAYRNAWIKAHSGDQSGIVAVQTLRNSIMTASFLASTSILLIMGAINLLGSMDSLQITMQGFRIIGPQNPTIDLVKVLLIIVTLSYTFFNFTSYLREVNYLSFILNIPKEKLDEIEGCDATAMLSQTFLTSGIHFSMGMRGYYFLIPLIMWIFSPVLIIGSTLLILFILLRRDLQG